MNDNTINFDETLPPAGNQSGRSSLTAGDDFGQYRVVRLLGRGGMGEVYEVEHTTLRRRYALKLLPADFANRTGALERFKREAEVMANLEHPNIVKVDEFGETDGRYWLRMELASGTEGGGPRSEGGDRRSGGGGRKSEVRTLGEYAEAQGGRLDPDEAALIFKQVLDGLAHAHEHGVVHRDLKPENILLFSPDTDNQTDETPVCKISDFGLVRMIGEEWVRSQAEVSVKMSMSVGGMATELPEGAGTSTKSMLGTFEYMSPEQKRGEDATAASDVYSVGLMMYRLLTGRQVGPRPPSYYADGLDSAWDDMILTALEENPSDRFADAASMRKRLPVPMEGETPSSRSASPEPTPPSAPKSPPPKPEPSTPEHQRFQPSEPRVSEPSPASASPPNPAAETRRATPEPRKKKSCGKKKIVLVLLALVLAVGGAYLLYQQGQHEAPARVPGEDWTSPATGMEFVWIPKLKCWVGKYEVTNGEYRKKERGHDSKEYEGHSLNGDRQPVVEVNYFDAQTYADWLTERDRDVLGGAEYRLPTEDEFTTFAQCGDGREYPWGNNWPPRSGQAGNYSGQESAWKNKIEGYRDGHVVTCDVEKSWENPWGLYGVGGNVWECTSESPDGDFDAWRGASWDGDFDEPLIEQKESDNKDMQAALEKIDSELWGEEPYPFPGLPQDYLRCERRYGDFASFRDNDYGFRLLLSR